MTISWEGGKNFKIKSKALLTKIGEKNILGTLEITSPGEYEVGGVQMEIIDGIIEVFVEGMTIGHIPKAKVLRSEELEKLNNIDVLLIGVGGGEFSDTKTATEVINQIEPSMVVPMYSQNLEEFTKEEGGKVQDELKLSKLELPQEGCTTIILNPSKG